MGVFADNFSDGFLNTTNFGVSLGNNGTITESLANGVLEGRLAGNLADAYLVYYKTVNPDRTKVWEQKWRIKPSNASGAEQVMARLMTYASGTPTVDSVVNTNANSALVCLYLNGTGLILAYFDAGGTPYFWNHTAMIWQTGIVGVAAAQGNFYTTIVSCNGSDFTLTWKSADESSTIVGPATIATSSVRSNGTDWFASGEPFNDIFSAISSDWNLFQYTGDEVGNIAPVSAIIKILSGEPSVANAIAINPTAALMKIKVSEPSLYALLSGVRPDILAATARKVVGNTTDRKIISKTSRRIN